MSSSNVEFTIQVYNALFTACIVLACLSLAGAVFIFFKFDIRSQVQRYIALLTGKPVKGIPKKKKLPTDAGRVRQVDLDFDTSDLIPAGLGPAGTTLLDSATSGQIADSAGKIRFRVTEDTVVIHTAETV